jgi:hypothetical protein
MITNIKHGNDLITVDFNLNQIRVLKDYNKQGEIKFINISNMDTLLLRYYQEKGFIEMLKIILEDSGYKIRRYNCEVLK